MARLCVAQEFMTDRIAFLNTLNLYKGLQRAQGPEEMCLSLERQNPSKTSEKMGYFDRVTVSLPILYTANQETEGSYGRLTLPRSPFRRRPVRQRGYGLRLLIFKMANNKVDLGQIRSEEIVYSRFVKIPLG